MKKKLINKITKKSESLDWSVYYNTSDNCFSFSKYSPAEQDFSVDVFASSINELVKALNERVENFDCSEETYLWLDKTGHGKNGAPYNMKDLYEDMENCETMLEELTEIIESLAS